MCGYICIEFINYMLQGKTLLDYTNLFSPNDFKKNDRVIEKYLRINNIIELADTAGLSSLERVNNYRLNQIDKIKDYFNNEISERKDIIKKLNKYIVSFDYLNKIFITLSVSFGTLSIASQATIVGIPVGIAGSSLTLMFTISMGVNKSLLRITKKRKKKHNKIIALAKSKLNTIDMLLSSALNDSKISHKKFTNIIAEKNMYENMKENTKEIKEEEEKFNGRTEFFRTYDIIKII